MSRVSAGLRSSSEVKRPQFGGSVGTKGGAGGGGGMEGCTEAWEGLGGGGWGECLKNFEGEGETEESSVAAGHCGIGRCSQVAHPSWQPPAGGIFHSSKNSNAYPNYQHPSFFLFFPSL